MGLSCQFEVYQALAVNHVDHSALDFINDVSLCQGTCALAVTNKFRTQSFSQISLYPPSYMRS